MFYEEISPPKVVVFSTIKTPLPTDWATLKHQLRRLLDSHQLVLQYKGYDHEDAVKKAFHLLEIGETVRTSVF